MKRIISCLLCICMLYAPAAGRVNAKTGDEVLLSLGFDSMATNAEAFEIKTSNVRTAVCQSDGAVPDKILKVTKEAKTATLDFALKQEAYSAVFEFDIRLSDEKTTRDICVIDKNGVMAKLITIGADGRMVTDDARELAKLSTDKWHKIAIVCRMGDKRCDVCVDGKCVGTRVLISGAQSMNAIKLFRISLAAGGYGSEFYLDNVRSYKGESVNPDITYPYEAYNPLSVEVKEEITVYDETSVYINSDFNSDSVGSAPSGVGAVPKDAANKVEVCALKSDADKSLLILKSAPGIDAYADFTVSSFSASDSVFEMSFYTEDTDSLKRGDVIRLAFDQKGRISGIIADVDVDTQKYSDAKFSSFWASNWAFSGAVYSKEGSYALVSATNPENLSDIFGKNSYGDLYSMSLSGNIMIYDEAQDAIYTGTVTDILTYEAAGERASRFFMKLRYATVDNIFIFKYE